VAARTDRVETGQEPVSYSDCSGAIAGAIGKVKTKLTATISVAHACWIEITRYQLDTNYQETTSLL
jgi:hypothetical protein